MITLHLVMESGDRTAEQARRRLDRFRESIQPAREWGITLVEVDDLAEAVAALMDGRRWSVDTLDEIAGLLRTAGYTIRELREEP